MIGYEARIIKVHHKLSRNSCSDKTNIRIIFFEDTCQGTIEHIYDVCPIKKFSREGKIIGNNKVGGFKFVVNY